jgi:transposase
VRVLCPNAEVAYDRFHVIARFGQDVIDTVFRLDQANALRSEPAR